MPPPRLRTARLLLREFQPQDVEPHAAMSRDEEVQRFLGGVRTPHDAFGNLATHAGHWALRGYGGWIVSALEDERFLGRIGFYEPPGWPGTEVGWKLAREAWGHGYATEAARAVIGYGFTVLDRETLCSLIDAGNTGSAAVARRLGYANAGPVETPFGPADQWVIHRDQDPWALRAATADDAPRLALARREAMARLRDISPPGWTAPEPSDAEVLEELECDGVCCVVAEPGGVLAGHVTWRPSRGATAAELSHLHVEPGWQGTPLATTLLTSTLDAARTAGLSTVHLAIPAASGRARRFYERLGFHPSGPAFDDPALGLAVTSYARDL